MPFRHGPSKAAQAATLSLVAALSSGSATGAPEPPSKQVVVIVLDEACVDRRADMCLRLADPGRSTAIESSLERLCTSPGCERGWHATELGKFGGLGPLCVCQRRRVIPGEGERCAEGFQETSLPGADGTSRIACELPAMRTEQDQGRWEWPSTPWDLLTCLQFARFGPGSGSCRRPVGARDP